MTFSIDAGKLARDAGNKRILLLFPKPSNGSHQVIEVTSATLDGQKFIEDSNEKFGRTVLRTWATPESGMAVVKVHAKVFNRHISDSDSLARSVELSEADRAKYLTNNAPFQWNRPEFHQVLTVNGLLRHDSQTAYDFMKNVATRFLMSNYRYEPINSYDSYDVYKTPEKMVQIPECRHFNCNLGSMLLVAIARANGIPAREEPMTLLISDGSSENHSSMEFFDSKYGWVPIDPAVMLSKDSQNYGSDLSIETMSAKVIGTFIAHVVLMDGVQWKYTTPMNSVASLPYVQGAFSYIAEDRSSGKAGIIPDVRFSIKNLPMGH